MAKGSYYYCVECGYKSAKWAGKCPQCGTWSSLEEVEDLPKDVRKATEKSVSVASSASNVKVYEFKDIEYKNEDRYKTKYEEFDRILGGGLLKGEVVLVTGNPGIGKSTLLLQVANSYKEYGDVLYISGEESPAQIKNRGERLKISGEGIYVMAEMDILNIYEYVVSKKPKVVIVDSIQTL